GGSARVAWGRLWPPRADARLQWKRGLVGVPGAMRIRIFKHHDGKSSGKGVIKFEDEPWLSGCSFNVLRSPANQASWANATRVAARGLWEPLVPDRSPGGPVAARRQQDGGHGGAPAAALAHAAGWRQGRPGALAGRR